MAVNISAMEFRDENFLEGVFAILKYTGLDPRSLELELTESVLMKRAESTESILGKLRARGVQVAVDDFGTGYSSLSYLRKFPIDALKIDQSFVRQITTAPDETTIVTAVISMGRSLKLRVVAEGVETQQELEFLQAHQCDEAQGYYFSRPVVASSSPSCSRPAFPKRPWSFIGEYFSCNRINGSLPRNQKSLSGNPFEVARARCLFASAEFSSAS
jgi:EAL domain-containing protein (putative c-di-GMP-specific phosphodiesterase class I)